MRCCGRVDEREVLEVGAAGFGDQQCVESEQAGQHVVVTARQSGLDQEGAELVRSSPSRVDSWETLGRRTWTAGE